MYRAYDIWKAYEILIIEGIYAYLDCADEWGWPVFPTLAFPGALMLAADFFLPRWLSVSLFLAVGLPMFTWFVSLIYTYFAYVHGRDRR